MVARWLDTCTSQHTEYRSREQLRKPTRLLNLNIGDSEDVRLVDGILAVDSSYIALSYYRGLVPQLLLLQSNHAAFAEGIVFSALSNIAKDAVTVYRALSVGYL